MGLEEVDNQLNQARRRIKIATDYLLDGKVPPEPARDGEAWAPALRHLAGIKSELARFEETIQLWPATSPNE